MNIFDEVKNALVNEKIQMDNPYQYVKFEVFVQDNDILYSWIVKRGFSWAFPLMPDQRTVKYFKTLNGAKRNFLKQFKIGE